MRKKRYILIPFLLLAGVLIAVEGCLNNTGTTFGSQVKIGMQIDSLNSAQISPKGDTLTVYQFRFVYGDGAVIYGDSTFALAPNSQDWKSFSVPNRTGQNPILIIRGPVKGSPTYKGFVLSVQKAHDGNSGIDTDFTGKQNYSMIIDGTYNGTDFTFKSKHAFKDTLLFAPIKVQEQNQQYVILLKANVNRWFRDTNGGYLDPAKDDNRSTISKQIEQSFLITTNTSDGQ